MSAYSDEQWVRSSYSGGEGGNCVEWSPTYATAHGVVRVRDSKNSDGPVLSIPTAQWSAFVSTVRAEQPSA